MAEFANAVGFVCYLVGLVLLGIGQIWLFFMIARKEPIIALLCFLAPCLVLIFVNDHWDKAKSAVLPGVVGFLLIIVSSLLGFDVVRN